MDTPINACRICGSADLTEFFSLGQMPAVNSFLSSEAQIAGERRYPLALASCSRCTHVQLTHMLDPKDIFEDYIYFSSMSDTVVRHGRALAERYGRELPLGPSDLVAELASNDGCILKPFRDRCRVLGVEPAKNIAAVANRDGVPTRAQFFDSVLARELRETEGPAKLILARNVVAHVPRVVDFIAGAGQWLSDQGVLHVEVPYLREMVEKLEFDTIYHEHLSYFSVTALNRLFAEAGLVLWDVEALELHGGSLAARGRKPPCEPTERVRQYLEAERAAGYGGLSPLQAFASGAQRLKEQIPSLLHDLRRRGASVAGYGAAAKGVVLTNYCGIDSKLLDFVADRSPYKQGKLMPGTHLPVVGPEQVLARRPDYLLVLAWNFFDEIATQLAEYARAGGKFVLPVPEPIVKEVAR
jgi:novobiocin biosynthesis protein NovU/D-mycarose 3-C-methyltransferase